MNIGAAQFGVPGTEVSVCCLWKKKPWLNYSILWRNLFMWCTQCCKGSMIGKHVLRHYVFTYYTIPHNADSGTLDVWKQKQLMDASWCLLMLWVELSRVGNYVSDDVIVMTSRLNRPELLFYFKSNFSTDCAANFRMGGSNEKVIRMHYGKCRMQHLVGLV